MNIAVVLFRPQGRLSQIDQLLLQSPVFNYYVASYEDIRLPLGTNYTPIYLETASPWEEIEKTLEENGVNLDTTILFLERNFPKPKNIYWVIVEPPSRMVISKITRDMSLIHRLCGNILSAPSTRLLNDGESALFVRDLISPVLEYEGNNLCCTKHLPYINRILNKAGVGIPLFEKIFYLDTTKLAKEYFSELNLWSNSGWHLYSLGDSLDKLNFVWNTKYKVLRKPEKIITVIPFSGSAYINVDEHSSSIKVDAKAWDEIVTNEVNLLNNNNAFRELIADIKDGKLVVVSDFGHSGKALITLVHIIGNLVDLPIWENILFIQVAPFEDEIRNNITKHLGFMPRIIFIEELPEPYFINSERELGGISRCVPRYSSEMWTHPPGEIWYDHLNPNFYRCNVNRLFSLLILCCVVNA